MINIDAIVTMLKKYILTNSSEKLNVLEKSMN